MDFKKRAMIEQKFQAKSLCRELSEREDAYIRRLDSFSDPIHCNREKINIKINYSISIYFVNYLKLHFILSII